MDLFLKVSWLNHRYSSLLTCKTVTSIRTSYKTQPAWHGGFLGSTTERRSQKKARNTRANKWRSGEGFLDAPAPISSWGFFALVRLYYFAHPTKTAVLRRLYKTTIF